MTARRSREPERTCIGCRQVRPKGELVRIARAPDGSILVDHEARASGRGACVHLSAECIKRARRRLAGALRIGNVDFEQLRSELPAV